MLVRLLIAAAFALLIAVCAQLSVPMVPVPMTLQTWAVLLAGLVLGPKWGVAAVGLYLGAAAAGLPVLSDGRGGLEALTGPTAGYLAGFLIAAGLAGRLSRQSGVRPLGIIGGLIVAHALILALGAAWLARDVGLQAALKGGVLPFLIGAVVKSVAAWAAWVGARRLQTRR